MVGRRIAALAVLALVLILTGTAAGARGQEGAGELTFFPQAGVLWQDLYPNNFVDVDSGPGVRDYLCGTQTYDGHTGTDSDLRSFREMDIGVPVFAALDGRIIDVQDGRFDRNYGSTTARADNHVVVQHAPGRTTLYGHLRRGIMLRRGQHVVAGQQIGWTASSGSSTWPHLHFTSKVVNQVVEPFAGPCSERASGWADQASFPTEPYLRDLALSAAPFTGRRDLPFDEAVRTGTFVERTSVIHSRVELGAAFAPNPGVLRIRILGPGGRTLHESSVVVRTAHGSGYWSFAHSVRLARVGRWRITVDLDGKVLADAPFDVVAASGDVVNRRPNRIAVSLAPAAPSPRGIVECRVRTSLVTEDPDFDIVSYRYRWTVAGELVRSVQSAALSDVLRKGVALRGKEIRCAVTPTDGRRDGRTAEVQAVAGR